MSGPPRIFDRQAIARARARAEQSGGDTFLFREAAQGIAARLAPIRKRFRNATDIDGQKHAMEILLPFANSWTRAFLSEEEAVSFVGAPFDLATSVLSLHSVNDLPGSFVQILRALRPDGVFAAALFGGSTLQELRHVLAAAELETRGGASPRVAPFADVRDLGQLLQRAGFALPVADVERTTVLYRDLTDLVRDLRAHSQTNVMLERSRQPMSRALFSRARELYAQSFADASGLLRATFDIVYLIGWSPSESQPKPLKPGSARMRLAAALGVKEETRETK